jgi:hypothetical protein
MRRDTGVARDSAQRTVLRARTSDSGACASAMLAEQAAAAGAEVVDVYAASRGRDACALPGVRWVEPYIPASAAAPLHPNLLGMKATADLVVAAAAR